MINNTADLEAFLNGCPLIDGKKICAIDTEADSLHRYRESLCLIQFTAGGTSVLFDPLGIDDLSPLDRYLEDAHVWMHGADYDMTMLKREFGKLPAKVFDTQIGARLLGIRKFGLGNLVEHYFGTVLSKSSQKADWGKRPLSATMIEYALNDVSYLLEMGDKICAELHQKNRHEWFIESCEAARTKVEARDETQGEKWRISGAGKLRPLGLAYLKALWDWRDREAEAWDRPSFMVSPNKQLIEWSIRLSEGGNLKPPKHFRGERIDKLNQALQHVRDMDKDQYPQRLVGKRHKRDKDFDDKVDAIISKRNKIAAELDIEGSLIASRAAIEEIAGGLSQPHQVLTSWQQNLLQL